MATALKTSQIALPRSVVTTVLEKAKDTSTIAALSPNMPQKFADTTFLVFNPSAEAEVVEEGGKKSAYDQSVKTVNAIKTKVVTTTRVSSELKWADEEDQLEIVSNIIADQAAAIGRALDYIVYHAVNPKTGAVIPSYTALTTAAAANAVTSTKDASKDIDALTDKLIDYNINGLALSRKFAADLRKMRASQTGMRLYPEIPLSLNVGNVDGIPAAVSGTVNGAKATAETKVLAIMGDFSLIKWGMIRDMFSEVIEYGDPDQGGDLKASNQIAYRTEAVLCHAVLDPAGFAVLKSDGK